MIHALSSNVDLFNALIYELMPDVEIISFVDEGLPFLSDARSRPQVIRRLKSLAFSAEESTALAVMLTCTAFGRLVDEIQEVVNIPVLSVMEIVADEAIKYSDNIGILGTHSGMLASASKTIQEQAALKGKKVEIKTKMCPSAFDALRRGDLATHDAIVLKYLGEFMGQVKVVVMPQPSMERTLSRSKFSETALRVPILSSARLSVQELKKVLDGLAPPP
jgi:Asp/Glu/hydantoin racemase